MTISHKFYVVLGTKASEGSKKYIIFLIMYSLHDSKISSHHIIFHYSLKIFCLQLLSMEVPRVVDDCWA